jgi:serralysin
MAPSDASFDRYVDYLAGGGGDERYAWPAATLTVNLTGLTSGRYVSAPMQESAKLALQAWTMTTGITFTLTSSASADITADNEEPSAGYCSTAWRGDELTDADISIGKDWMDGYPADERWGIGDYGLQTFIHEIGHALGLYHGGDYDGDANWDRDAIFTKDTNQYSVMSYFVQSNFGDATDLNLATPGIADIAAIRELYGALPVNAGNTTYGRSGYYDFAANPDAAFTIADMGGVDTIDLRGLGAGARLDLRPGAFSNLNGHVKNLAIAHDTTIERGYGGTKGDVLVGNGAHNLLRGYGGADVVMGGNGMDTLEGAAGADRLSGGNGADLFRFNAIAETSGDLILDFGNGTDRIALSAIDARAGTPRNDAFAFIGRDAFGAHAGELRYGFASGDTLLTGDRDGDGRADFMLRLEGQIALTAVDFIL